MLKRTKSLYIFGTFMFIVLAFIFALSIDASFKMMGLEFAEECEHEHFGEWEMVTPPSCTEPGVKKRECEDCGIEEFGQIDKAPHNFRDGECADCGEKQPGYDLNGEGSGQGDIQSPDSSVDLNDSGDIGSGDEGEDGEPRVALEVYSEISAMVYLRYISYGDFNGRKWSAGKDYGFTFGGGFGANYFMSSALEQSNVSSYTLKVKVHGNQYYLPYYMNMAKADYEVQKSDVKYSGDSSKEYSLLYYNYDYTRNGAPLKEVDPQYAEAEAQYREFVYDNYLTVPSSSKELLQSIITDRGFDVDDPDVVSKVARYVKNSATYNLKYDRALDNEPDIVTAFLTKYKEGICQHYATTATLLFRTLGIPARYAGGYVGDTIAGAYKEITTENAHAWVEIYLDGYGWVYVEVTGSGGGAGNQPVGGDPNCDHEFGDWEVTEPPTCVEFGEQVRTCEHCGRQEKELIDPTGEHIWSDWEEVTPAHCGDAGEKRHVCEYCGTVETEVIPPEREHEWTDWEIQEETCGEDGYKDRECTLCQKHEHEVLPATGDHQWNDGEVTQPATCGDPGIMTFTCDVCQQTRTEEIPATGEHTWGDWHVSIPPTCTEPGEDERFCDVCHQRETKLSPATEHKYNEWIETKQPSCSEDGEKVSHCENCGDEKRMPVPSLPHTFGEWILIEEENCGVDGSHKHICSVCGAEEIEKIPATGKHVYNDNDWVQKVPATCGEPGIEAHNCTVCGKEQTREIPATEQHVWSDEGVVTKEPTCGEPGVKTYTCTVCGKTRNDSIEPTDAHVWSDEGVVTKEPTCGEEGEMTFTCDVCHKTKTEEIPRDENAHVWGDYIIKKPPICGEPGINERTCTKCGKTEETEIPATEQHEYDLENVEVLFAPNCENKGLCKVICKKCKHTSYVPIDPLGHKWDDEVAVVSTMASDFASTNSPNVQEPTCTEPGYYTHTCLVCGKTEKVELAPLGHKVDEWKTTKEPDCIHPGTQEGNCTRCGVAQTREIAPTGEHVYGEWIEDKASTCTEPGHKYRECQTEDCDAREEQDLPLKEHQFGEWQTVVEATCTQPGQKKRTCSVCGHNEYENIEPTGQHNYKEEVVKEPTCTEPGQKKLTCDKCGDVKFEEIPTNGEHQWNSGVVTKEPTCTENGQKTYTCEKCGETRTEEIETEGHNFGDLVVDKEPSCTENGIGHRTCEKCGEVKAEQIEKKEHEFGEDGECKNCHEKQDKVDKEENCRHHWNDWIVEKESTCQDFGWKSRTCNHCGAKETLPIEKQAHKWTEWNTTKEASCSEEGTMERSCSVCKEKETQKIDKKAHTFGDWQTEEDSTCSKEGVMKRSCSVCHEEETKKIDKKEHKYGEWRTEKEATCGEVGLSVRTCENCKHREEKSIPPTNQHEFEWVTEKEATCTQVGIKKGTCKNCHSECTVTIDAKGHEWDEGTVTVPPTCVSEGTMTFECNVCHEKETRNVPATGKHKYGDWIDVQAATCDKPGIRKHICKVCNKEEADISPATGEHVFGAWLTLEEPTCGHKGTKQATCTQCGKTLTQDIPATGKHDFDEWEEVTEATCDHAGLKQRKCKNCGYTENEITDRLQHDFNDDGECENCHAHKVPDIGDGDYDYDVDSDDTNLYYNETAERLALTIIADVSAELYLRNKSYGDFSGNGWKAAPEYGKTFDEKYGMNYLFGKALESYTTAHTVTVNVTGNLYYLPYFVAPENGNYTAQSSDVRYKGDTKSYQANFYTYNFLSSGAPKNKLSGNYAEIEKAYRDYVYKTYISVPDNIKEYLLGIIDREDIHKYDANVYSEVAAFVSSAAKYNLNYNHQVEQSDNFAKAFFETYREGVCQHFASAATLLFRTLGIPARYTTGFYAESRANELVSVMSTSAHAWVEVYIDGFGWAPIEVTGSSNGGNGSGGGTGGDSGEIGGGDDGHLDPDIEIVKALVTTQGGSKTYDGTPMSVEQVTVSGLKNGHKVDESSIVYPEFTKVGEYKNEIYGLKIVDEQGNNVTNQYDFDYQYGDITITKRQITITTQSESKVYDGKYLKKEGYTMTGTLGEGDRMDNIGYASIKNVGSVENVIFFDIFNVSNENVTDMYDIKYEFGTLSVSVREITVKTKDKAEKFTPGATLVCDEFELYDSKGNTLNYEITETNGRIVIFRLDNGDLMTLVFNASCTTRGRISNTVELKLVTIFDASGEVTNNYKINYEYGNLSLR